MSVSARICATRQTKAHKVYATLLVMVANVARKKPVVTRVPVNGPMNVIQTLMRPPGNRLSPVRRTKCVMQSKRMALRAIGVSLWAAVDRKKYVSFQKGAAPEDAGECLVVDCLVNSDCFSFRPYCTNRYQCVECTLDEHCGDAEACINDMCIFEPECGATDLPDCPEGSECFTGFCAEPAGTCDEPEVLAIGVVNGNTSGGLMTHDSAECGFGSDKGRGPEAVCLHARSGR